MTTYVLVEVGCIECGDDTLVRALTDELPADALVVHPGDSVELTYHASLIAIPVTPEAQNPSMAPSPKESTQ